jgi:nitrite reductase/ring-hydroxylating ferredoxin subunit
MPEKKYKWYKIADAKAGLQFGENNIMQIEIAGKKICIVKRLQGLAGCTAKCPHAGGNMAEGHLNKDGNIVCPVHKYVFNLENGRDVTGEGYFLKIYPVRVNEVGIFLGIEEGGIFSWLK